MQALNVRRSTAVDLTVTFDILRPASSIFSSSSWHSRIPYTGYHQLSQADNLHNARYCKHFIILFFSILRLNILFMFWFWFLSFTSIKFVLRYNLVMVQSCQNRAAVTWANYVDKSRVDFSILCFSSKFLACRACQHKAFSASVHSMLWLWWFIMSIWLFEAFLFFGDCKAYEYADRTFPTAYHSSHQIFSRRYLTFFVKGSGPRSPGLTTAFHFQSSTQFPTIRSSILFLLSWTRHKHPHSSLSRWQPSSYPTWRGFDLSRLEALSKLGFQRYSCDITDWPMRACPVGLRTAFHYFFSRLFLRKILPYFRCHQGLPLVQKSWLRVPRIMTKIQLWTNTTDVRETRELRRGIGRNRRRG